MSRARAELPSGTVSFLFTDIEGSTRLFRLLEDGFPSLLEAHNQIVREAIEGSGGAVVKTEGDAFFAAFSSAAAALTACRRAQRDLAAHPWPREAQIRVRMGLHSGRAIPADDDYVALAVNQAARVVSAAHGGQILMTEATQALLPDDAPLRALGRFQLRDFEDPEPLYEVADGEGFPAPRALPAAVHNFPRPRTSFVGRGREVDALRELAADVQLITLVGTGGTGKTRLARELAIRVLDDFPDGAWLVELAPLSRAGQVLPAIAHTLGVREAPGENLQDALLDRLSGARLLLVLDNCEHVLDRAAELVDAVLVAAPTVCVWATSRERLAVSGERIWPVAPLAVPNSDSSTEEAIESGAVRLFADRAADARPGFRLASNNVAAVIDICRRLDGLPLALEFAAARTAALAPGQIAERLDSRFELLTGGGRTALPRHRTLRATLEWSYELLSEVERQALRRLSVFAGAFSLDAAEAVVHGAEISEEDVASLVERLVQNSLLELRDDARFLALETVREYGRLMLAEADEEREARDRHLQWVSASVERRDGEEEDAWHARIEAEYGELRAAIGWSLSSGSPAAGLRALARTGSFLADHAHTAEGNTWLDALLERADECAPENRADGLAISSRLAWVRGDYEIARKASEEGLAIAKALEDGARASHFMRLLGNAALYEGRIADARALYLRATEEAPQPEISAIRTRLNLGLVELMLGNLDAAEAQYRAVLEIAERGHPGEVPFTRSALAAVATQRGDGAAAAEWIADAIKGHRATSNLYELADAVDLAGAACLLTGDGEAGAWLLGAGDVVYEAAGGVRPNGFFADRYRGWTQAARDALGDGRFEELLTAGRGVTVDDAVNTAFNKMDALRSSERVAPRSNSQRR